MSHPAEHAEHRHPGTGTYLAIAAVLFIITIVEVGVFYVPAFIASCKRWVKGAPMALGPRVSSASSARAAKAAIDA